MSERHIWHIYENGEEPCLAFAGLDPDYDGIQFEQCTKVTEINPETEVVVPKAQIDAAEKVAEALRYYAKRHHVYGDFENPSGEPSNILCLNGTDEPNAVESGELALSVLKKYGWEE